MVILQNIDALIILSIIHIPFINCQGYREVLASSNACYPATGYRATIFNAPETGEIVGVKAVYNSGYISPFSGASGTFGGSGMQVELLKVTNAAIWYGTVYYPVSGTQGYTPASNIQCARGCRNNHYTLSPYTNGSPKSYFLIRHTK